MTVGKIAQRMLRAQLEAHEASCREGLVQVRRYLDRMEKALDDTDTHPTMGTAESVRAMAEAHTSLYQAMVLRDVLRLLGDYPQ